ncbi:hypothetical protein GQ457_11G024250 [Hibiscus cannabinus]
MRAFASHPIDFGASFKDNHVDGVRNCNALTKTERNKGEITKQKRAQKGQVKARTYMFTPMLLPENHGTTTKKKTHLVARQILTIVFLKNFSESTTDEDLNKIFDGSGPITSVVVIRDADGKAKELQIYQKHMTPLQLLCCQVEEI